MKTKVFFIFLFLQSFLISFSQAYIPFIQEGKVWTEASGSSIDTMHYTSIYSSTFGDDTLINNKLYKEVLFDGIYLSCFVYEDTTLKKVYCLYPPDYEFLLYDFNLQIGDTLWQEICSIVTNKSIVFFAGKYRTRIEFYYGYDMVWYEGIGSLRKGVFSDKCLVGGITRLTCYFENDSLLFHDPIPQNDCFNLTEEQEILNNPIKSYFSNNVLNIETASSEKHMVNIYDLFGRLINTKEFSRKISIELSALSKGIYIYFVQSENKNEYLKSKIIVE